VIKLNHMKKKIILTVCSFFCCFAILFGEGETAVSTIKCEYEVNPLGVENLHPRLSWLITSKLRNQLQVAYQVLVATSPEKLLADKGDMWDSKKEKSDQSILVEYKGKPLQAGEKYYWKVKIWTSDGKETFWSKPSMWQMGLLTADDWGGAKWITMAQLDESKFAGLSADTILNRTKNTLPILRKEFYIDKPFATATVFISGLGHFDMKVNGQKVGDHFLDPGWTNYEKYASYVTFDVTKQFAKGKNAIAVMLGNGFYDVPKGGHYRKGDLVLLHGLPKLICKILVQFPDGTQQFIESNQTWKVNRSPITYSSIYGGEDYDASLEQDGWDKASYTDAAWPSAVVVKGSEKLVADRNSPNKVMESIVPVKVFKSQKGKWVYDLGQNASGIVRLTVAGKAGATVRAYPAELIDADSTVNQKATGSPYYFSYTLKGKPSETWQPQFSYYGFRYVQIEGGVPDGKANPEGLPVVKELTGLHTRNSADKVGTFTCSNDLFNKTNTLIDWSIKSNMQSVLTDCPHREKLGWLEQTHLMGTSIQFNYDIARLYSKTVADMQSSQLSDGMIPAIAPEYCIFNDKNGKPSMFRDSPEWGSAYVILPWYMYQWYGDTKLLQDNYDGMKKYVDYLGSKATNKIVSYGLGDWYDIGPKRPGVSQLTSLGVTGTATWFYDVNIMASAAKLLGKKDDVARYTSLAKDIKAAFNQTYFKKDSFHYDLNSQAANGMALYMNLVEPQNKAKVLESLIKDIRSHNNALTAGDVGYRYVLQALQAGGASNVIFDMNSRSDVPGYGYQIKQGATALTESWQALRTVSNNHLMLGHLMEWFYAGLAGIGQDENSAAYKNIVIKPQPVGDITDAKASYQSIYGLIRSEWKIQGKLFSLNVEIPANTTGVVYLPTADAASVTETSIAMDKVKDAQFLRNEGGYLLYKVSSGTYQFKMNYLKQ
jgi:alpha-L-rhamnosidase